MFGTYRTVLASFVLLQHLGQVPGLGQFAVQSFFVLSGFLMTYVMQSSYGYSAWGRTSFVLNRCLRLYPSYWVVLLISVFVLSWMGDAPSHFHRAIEIPDSPINWLSNVTMLYPSVFPVKVSPQVSPSTWALTVELVYYAVICLGGSATKRRVWIWVAIGLAYHLAVNLAGFSHFYRHFAIPAGSLPFSVGALLYIYRDRIALPSRLQRLDGNFAGALAAMTTAMMALTSNLTEEIAGGALTVLIYYANIALVALLIGVLMQLTGSRKVDRLIGNFSYHIYISHYLVGLLVFNLLFDLPAPIPLSPEGFAATTVTLAGCLLLSVVLTKTVDDPIEQVRKHVRNAGSTQPTAAATS